MWWQTNGISNSSSSSSDSSDCAWHILLIFHSIQHMQLSRFTCAELDCDFCIAYIRYFALFPPIYFHARFWRYAFGNFLLVTKTNVILFDQLHLSATVFFLFSCAYSVLLFPFANEWANPRTVHCTPTYIYAKWENKQTHSHLSGNHIAWNSLCIHCYDVLHLGAGDFFPSISFIYLAVQLLRMQFPKVLLKNV